MTTRPNSSWAYPVYRAITSFLHPIAAEPFLRLFAHKEDVGERYIRHRLGKWNPDLDTTFTVSSPSAPTATTTTNNIVWFHAASVGESLSTIPILVKLCNQCLPTTTPAASTSPVRVVLSVGTRAGRAASKLMLAQAGLSPSQVCVVVPPIDTPQAVHGFLSHFQPQRGIMMESELWPNLIHTARANNIPLSILNGRLSKRAYQRWSKYKAGRQMLHGMLDSFDLVLSQSVQDTLRYTQVLTCNNSDDSVVHTIPNLKLAPFPRSNKDPTEWNLKVDAARQLFQTLARNNKGGGNEKQQLNIVVASTHEHEEGVVARALRDTATLHGVIYVPRHPDRVDSVIVELSKHVDIVRRAQVKDGAVVLSLVEEENTNEESHNQGSWTGVQKTSSSEVIVVSAIGMLTALYSAADVAIVGGGLVDTSGAVGQHNVLEPLREGCVVVCGQHSDDSFHTDIVSRLELAVDGGGGGGVGAAAHPSMQNTNDFVEKEHPCLSFAHFEDTLQGGGTSLENVLTQIQLKGGSGRRTHAASVANLASTGVLDEIWSLLFVEEVKQ